MIKLEGTKEEFDCSGQLIESYHIYLNNGEEIMIENPEYVGIGKFEPFKGWLKIGVTHEMMKYIPMSSISDITVCINRIENQKYKKWCEQQTI